MRRSHSTRHRLWPLPLETLAFAGLMVSLCVIIPRGGFAQRVDFNYATYGIEVAADNVIQNAWHLETFFDKLDQLSQGRTHRVSIVHIGDSHIQADYMTSVIRHHFHRQFGNAGRGLVVPLRIARTNEPANYRTSSRKSWRSKRCVFPEQALPIGIGGVTIESDDAGANVEIHMNDPLTDYRFNTLTLFYQKDAESFDFAVRTLSGRALAYIDASADDSLVNHTRVGWAESVNAIDIQSVKVREQQRRATLFGLVLENGDDGVLYHSIGVNGAKYKHYNAAAYFAAQTAALSPDLFIISLGTNESADYPYVDRSLGIEIHRLVTSLQQTNPQAAFIVVTPQEVFRKRNQANPGILNIRNQIIAYAVEHGFAFYDLYRAMGSPHNWSQHTLLSHDGLHLSKDGYVYQGNLFYDALMKSYNAYVPD